MISLQPVQFLKKLKKLSFTEIKKGCDFVLHTPSGFDSAVLLPVCQYLYQSQFCSSTELRWKRLDNKIRSAYILSGVDSVGSIFNLH